MGVTIGGDAAKIGKNTNLLMVMCVRLLQKPVCLTWRIGPDSKKEMAIKYVRELCAITREWV